MHMTLKNTGMSKRVVFIFGRPVVVSLPLRSVTPKLRPASLSNQLRPSNLGKRNKESQILSSPGGTAVITSPSMDFNITHVGMLLVFIFCISLIWAHMTLKPPTNLVQTKSVEVVAVDQKRKPDESWDQHVRRLINMSLANISVANINDRQLECLAKNIYFESRGQPLAGQVGVAKVTLNRVNQGWAQTVCGVVYQKIVNDVCQFSWACNSQTRKPSGYDWKMAVGIAAATLNHGRHISDPTGGATHFHATYIQPAWQSLMTGARQIGDHIFYRPKPKK